MGQAMIATECGSCGSPMFEVARAYNTCDECGAVSTNEPTDLMLAVLLVHQLAESGQLHTTH